MIGASTQPRVDFDILVNELLESKKIISEVIPNVDKIITKINELLKLQILTISLEKDETYLLDTFCECYEAFIHNAKVFHNAKYEIDSDRDDDINSIEEWFNANNSYLESTNHILKLIRKNTT